MCKRNSPQKNKASAGCVRETPQIKKLIKIQHGMCYRNSPDLKKKSKKKKKKKKKKKSLGCVRETLHRKIKPARDV